jgi:hypothetical protein
LPYQFERDMPAHVIACALLTTICFCHNLFFFFSSASFLCGKCLFTTFQMRNQLLVYDFYHFFTTYT